MGGICNGPLPPKARCLEWLVMSNHYHVILHVDRARTHQWDAIEVVKRWHRLFKGCKQSQAFSRGEVLEGADRILLDSAIAKWQRRLSDISWFMRVVNEKIARRANAEDGCKGSLYCARCINKVTSANVKPNLRM